MQRAFGRQRTHHRGMRSVADAEIVLRLVTTGMFSVLRCVNLCR